MKLNEIALLKESLHDYLLDKVAHAFADFAGIEIGEEPVSDDWRRKYSIPSEVKTFVSVYVHNAKSREARSSVDFLIALNRLERLKKKINDWATREFSGDDVLGMRAVVLSTDGGYLLYLDEAE